MCSSRTGLQTPSGRNPSGRRQIRKQNVTDGVANPVRQEIRPAGGRSENKTSRTGLQTPSGRKSVRQAADQKTKRHGRGCKPRPVGDFLSCTQLILTNHVSERSFQTSSQARWQVHKRLQY